MPAYNFGMLTAGLPDLAQRQVSNPIMGEDYYQGQQNDWLKAWQPKWDAATPQYVQTSAGGFSSDIGQIAQQLANAPDARNGFQGSDTDWYNHALGLVQDAQQGGEQGNAYLSHFGVSPGTYTAPTGYYDDSARKALEAERDRQNAQFAAATQGRVQNQQAQQTAYNQSNGGGFSGGIINASYGTPATTGTGGSTDASGVPMPNTQPWGMPAYGGPTGAQSQAGFGGSGWGEAAQPAGWGGPFTNKNPWAAS